MGVVGGNTDITGFLDSASGVVRTFPILSRLIEIDVLLGYIDFYSYLRVLDIRSILLCETSDTGISLIPERIKRLQSRCIPCRVQSAEQSCCDAKAHTEDDVEKT